MNRFLLDRWLDYFALHAYMVWKLAKDDDTRDVADASGAYCARMLRASYRAQSRRCELPEPIRSPL